MATDDVLIALRDHMRAHRVTLAGPTFAIEDLIAAVDTLLEVQELNLESLVTRLIRARRTQARIDRGLVGMTRRRRRKAVH